jgi:hypothetical protein
MTRVRLLDQELDEQPQMDEEGIDGCHPQDACQGRAGQSL